ncbi:hypothetical protein [Azospirillum sp. Sh1]|uniref:hypothetical protein n=1 Tax=Azospirillum sp. Sh1 TaxID=2607285 RepID=UPI0011EE17A8|nr:hypothetical protein [Azospirillum sp. Sh1]KAA0571166.1 hypothetical protein FZ029_27555 [Azospirillum sp. Sh1]
MALLMLFATTLINHLLVSEAEEVESLLAETRVYWAMNGHLNYMLSRASAQGLCANGEKKSTLALNQADACTAENDGTGSYPSYSGRNKYSRVGSLQDYLDGSGELQQSGTIDNPGSLVWYYPQNANATNIGTTALNDTNVTNDANKYHFSIRGVVSDLEIPNGSNTNDGQLRVDFEVTDVTDSTTLPVLRNIADRVGRLTVGFCVLDQTGGSPPPAATSCATTKDEGSSLIQFIQRNFPFSY